VTAAYRVTSLCTSMPYFFMRRQAVTRLTPKSAAAMDMEALIVLQGTGVYLAPKGDADHIAVPGLTPLKILIENFIR